MFLKLFFCSSVGFLLGWWFSKIWVKLTNPIKRMATVKQFHFHHSVWGLVAILISLFFINNIFIFIILLSSRAGIILEHIINHEGFIFITKDKKSN